MREVLTLTLAQYLVEGSRAGRAMLWAFCRVSVLLSCGLALRVRPGPVPVGAAVNLSHLDPQLRWLPASAMPQARCGFSSLSPLWILPKVPPRESTSDGTGDSAPQCRP